MKLSDIFKFKLFEGGDKANLKIVNENFEIAEKELAATNKEITDKVTEINNKITELNGLLGDKLDVSKIANNLVTTEAGYALDARMGKVLNDKVVSVDNMFKNPPFSTIHELQATATFEGKKAHISFSFGDTMTGLVIITGNLDGTPTYFSAILCVGTRYTTPYLVYKGGANVEGISLENNNTICVESNGTPTGLGTVKVTHIGSFG